MLWLTVIFQLENHFQLRADSIQDLSCDSLSPGRRASQPGRFFRKRSRSDVGKNLKIIAKELKKQCKKLAENDFQVEIKLINTDGIAQINYLIFEPGNYRK
jgi:hypothetical protein